MTVSSLDWWARARALVIVALALGAAAGCRTVDAENYACSASRACPPGFTCGGDDKCHATTKPSARSCDGGDAAGCGLDGGLDGRDARDGATTGDARLCTATSAGGECTPANPCHLGRTVCSEAGAETCSDTGELRGNGLSCGDGMVCSSGSCVACAAGMACDRPGQPCKLGQIACTTGAPVCMEAG